MDRKIKIHYHTDNVFWSGAEQMLTCLFGSKEIKNNFEISFSYRQTREFEFGMYQWIAIAQGGHPALYPTLLPLQLFSSKFYDKWYWPFKYLSLPFDTIKIYKVLKRAKPDILHIHNGGYPGALSCNAAVFAVRWLKKKPKVVYFVNNLPKKRGIVQRIIERPMDNLLDKEVEVFLSGSHSVQGAMLETLLGKDFFEKEDIKRFKVISNTIHNHSLKDRKEVRKSLGIYAEEILIASIGVFEERKGHVYLLKAFGKIAQKYGVKVVLLLVGEGKEELKLKETAYGVALFRRDTENSYSYINACDIYVQPSIAHEDFPIVVLQAMSLGKPVIGTKVAGISEQIQSGINGFLVEPKNIDELENRMECLIKKKVQRKFMGKNSKWLFEECYSYDKIMNRYVEFYKEQYKKGGL